MKCLFIGHTHSHSTSQFYLKALKRLGFDCKLWNPSYFESPSLWGKLFQKAAKSPLPSYTVSIEDLFCSTIRGEKWRLILVFAENFISSELLTHLKNHHLQVGGKIIYHSHDNNFVKGILKPQDFLSRLRHYDRIFTTKSFNVEAYRSQNVPQVHYLPSAYAPQIHRPHPRTLSYQVSFIGTYDHSRLPFLHTVGWENLSVWGNRWTKYKGFQAHREKITPHAIYNNAFSSVLSSSLISLGLLRKEACDLHTQRTFEIPASGCLQLTERNDEILGFFKENEEVLCFDSMEELKCKVDFYLSHPELCYKIAQKGYEKVTQGGHTYLDRMKEMLIETFGHSWFSKKVATLPRWKRGSI